MLEICRPLSTISEFGSTQKRKICKGIFNDSTIWIHIFLTNYYLQLFINFPIVLCLYCGSGQLAFLVYATTTKKKETKWKF